MTTTTGTSTSPRTTRVLAHPLTPLRALRAELYALTSTRSTWLFMAAIVVGMLPASLLMNLEQASWGDAAMMSDVVLLVIIYAVAFFMLPPTLPWTYQATPRRSLDMFARFAAGLFLCLISVVVGMAGSIGVFTARGIDLDLSSPQELIVPALRLLIVPTLSAFLAWLTKSSLVGSMVMIADFYLVEALVVNTHTPALAFIGSLLPVNNIGVAAGHVLETYQFPEWAAPLILAAWLVTGAVLAWLVATRRPITS
ncbi:hypothetical protein C1Y63_00610 [Corynebacterium sp. 13CS0277]|uniref:hypothetical protein n=1 Tax=Corynebacterium sp. 13CS0277 TaxID=2071994 RepID=UPI000D038A98|nr:hypothetical protein [Corynebacterium sp. 13CS0277]PRQ12594.1 hypothetical protein C1Y63_00610 [Corynebacterium sp. 13CS0277]